MEIVRTSTKEGGPNKGQFVCYVCFWGVGGDCAPLCLIIFCWSCFSNSRVALVSILEQSSGSSISLWAKPSTADVERKDSAQSVRILGGGGRWARPTRLRIKGTTFFPTALYLITLRIYEAGKMMSRLISPSEIDLKSCW